MRGIILIGFLIAIFSFVSCKVDPKVIEPLPSTGLRQVIPQGWPDPVYNFENNPISEDKFILGRSLFYEGKLSKDNTISCGSCHQHFSAFANNDHRVSHGINGLEGKRNSPGIFNLAWHTSFMHDGGINHIEQQPPGPITNTVEMAEDLNNVVSKLQATEKYRDLFKKAYGDEEVSTQRMFKAIALFMGLMESYESKYDKYKRQEHHVELTDEELRGYNLFLANCNACHKEPLFSDFAFRNNGLAPDPVYQDKGRYGITSNTADMYKFKTPSLRNIAYTEPYMHDGRYQTLEECLDHYTGKVTNKTNLDPLLQNGLSLSAQDKSDIIVFLRTLSDEEFIHDERFDNPNHP